MNSFLSDMLKNMLRSKRFWVVVITMGAHALLKYHFVISDASVNDIADQALLVMGSVGVIGTKVMDSMPKTQ